MRVRIERVEYEAPIRGDHLVKVPRECLFRSADDIREKGKLLISGIVCDACNSAILTPYVWVLVLCNPMRPWGVLCVNCIERYHKRLKDRMYVLRKLRKEVTMILA